MPLELRKASKALSKLRIGLAGVSGSGKTFSALKMAFGICGDWKKIAVIDTENKSADLYSTLGEYNVITLEAPYTPERYAEAIKKCEMAGMEVIIIDSITHVWKGEGGLLEYNNSLGGKFSDWAKTTPRYQLFLQSILRSTCHIITTVRKKTAYTVGTNDNGKQKVEKTGLDDEIRDGFEYELTAAFNLNLKHLAEPSKDRTGLFMDKPEEVITIETGKKLKAWADIKADVATEDQREDFLNRIAIVGYGQADAEKVLGKMGTPFVQASIEELDKARGLFEAKPKNKPEEPPKEPEKPKEESMDLDSLLS